MWCGKSAKIRIETRAKRYKSAQMCREYVKNVQYGQWTPTESPSEIKREWNKTNRKTSTQTCPHLSPQFMNFMWSAINFDFIIQFSCSPQPYESMDMRLFVSKSQQKLLQLMCNKIVFAFSSMRNPIRFPRPMGENHILIAQECTDVIKKAKNFNELALECHRTSRPRYVEFGFRKYWSKFLSSISMRHREQTSLFRRLSCV